MAESEDAARKAIRKAIDELAEGMAYRMPYPWDANASYAYGRAHDLRVMTAGEVFMFEEMP